MKRAAFVLLWLLLMAAGCQPTTNDHPKAPTAPPSPLPLAPTHQERPRFSPDGRHIAFHAGPEGERQVYVMNADGTDVRALTEGPGDHCEPTWNHDGSRVVYASRRAGTYDLWVVAASGGAPEQVTQFPGDAREPSLSPLLYGFYAIGADACGPGDLKWQTDFYEKVFFTYHDQERQEIWFASLKPDVPPPSSHADPDFPPSPHNTHHGRISPLGHRCHAPSSAPDGTSLVWVCSDPEGVVYDATAEWTQSFTQAVANLALDDTRPGCDHGDAACLATLPRSYASFHGVSKSDPRDRLSTPSISNNQIFLIATRDGHGVWRERWQTHSAWQALPIQGEGLANLIWSPDGKRIAYDMPEAEGRRIAWAESDHYLQEVRNLIDFPELYVKGTSERLQANRFVARPGQGREFYAVHERLRYQRRPQFITADAALQLFRDDFQRRIQHAEVRASEHLLAFTEQLLHHFTARYRVAPNPHDLYYATLFAVAWAPLHAAANMERLTFDDAMTLNHLAYFPDEIDTEEAQRLAELQRPIMERLPALTRAALDDLPEAFPAPIRQATRAHLDDIFAHQGVGDLAVPGRERPARIDWSQFQVRGPYAENALAGYFLALSWYAQAPLPFDASLHTLIEALQQPDAEGSTPLAHWRYVDDIIGAFMGRPVDATPAHLVQVHTAQATLFAPFAAAELREQLETLRGPIRLRDAEAAESGAAAMALKITLFPKRQGLDTTFFRGLTHPDVPLRGMPNPLDVMAVLGSDRALEHAIAAAPEKQREAYDQALRKVVAELPGRESAYWSTDLYHSWLAVLAVLVTEAGLSADAVLAFAATTAWQDRLLSTALASYTQLKHSAVLYNMQDMSVECGPDESYLAMVEQPYLPRPRGFVDPMPEFFTALAKLARVTAQRLTPENDDEAAQDESVVAFIDRLAQLAQGIRDAQPLSDADHRWIEWAGALMEKLTLDHAQMGFQMGGNARAERGVALVTDVHTNLQQARVLQLGVGRLLDFYVAVPDGPYQSMTQGAIFSFYAFEHPMSERMTDDAWAQRLESGEVPPRPAWLASFVEEELPVPDALP